MGPRYRISKDFALSSSHRLHGLRDDHPCSRLHGHNYVVRVTLAAETLDDVGFVVDYRELGDFKDWLDETFDHRHLNDVLEDNPTSERFAELLWSDLCPRIARLRPDVLVAVAVSETPKTWAVCDPAGIT